jgi:hypothetical protein
MVTRRNPCEDRTCIQCRGRLDGTEQLVAIGGQAVWLHPQCARFYLRAFEQREQQERHMRHTRLSKHPCMKGEIHE